MKEYKRLHVSTRKMCVYWGLRCPVFDQIQDEDILDASGFEINKLSSCDPTKLLNGRVSKITQDAAVILAQLVVFKTQAAI